jgi:hypothetical protein
MTPSRLSIAVIALLGLMNLGRGSIHLFAPDGGLKMIAGLDISVAPAVILSLIGGVGAGQITFALVDFVAAGLVRAMVRPLLIIHTIQAGLTVFLLFVWRPMPHDVPGQWGALVTFILIGFFAAIEYSRRRDVAA